MNDDNMKDLIIKTPNYKHIKGIKTYIKALKMNLVGILMDIIV